MMTDISPDILHEIQATLPELRKLDTRKNIGPLPPEEVQRWSMLYARVLELFGQKYEALGEQRRALRLPFRVKVNYIIDSEHFHAMSHDISMSGIAVDFSRAISLNAPARMEIGIGSSRFLGLWKRPSFHVEGEVRWVSQQANRIGFEFLNLKESHRKLIQDAMFREIEHKIALCEGATASYEYDPNLLRAPHPWSRSAPAARHRDHCLRL